MKKSIVIAVLGIAAGMASVSQSHAQGSIIFANYAGNGSDAPVTISGGPLNGQYVGGDFYANLLFSFDNFVTTNSLNLGQTTPFYGVTGGSPGTDGAGYFPGLANTVSIPGYTAGNVWFIVQAYNGATYASSTIFGQSGVVQLSNISTALPTGGFFADNPFLVGSALQPFTVTAVPEPSTLALAGLGGLAVLALRRKKA